MRNYYPNFFKRFIHTGLDLLFPRHCLGCEQEGIWLCDYCLKSLPRSFSPNEDKIFSVFEYNSPVVKQVIWRLKYQRTLELAKILARPMYGTLLEELEDELLILSPMTVVGNSRRRSSGNIVLIPVPLSPRRFRSRGYNQAEELAKQIARLNPEQFEVRTDIVKKIKNTPTQVSVHNRTDRLNNLHNAFVVRYPISHNKSFWTGKIIVIVDDVSTTGATINEIRRLLTSHLGARHVYGLVVAHG